ncbi:MAG: DNA polymerase III subunit beta [SAR324 cluster bacterium]|uniref:Beta sliding clamp n=1 Tax=SAR324 cluster bacterium TaxID=2024889 RepID=A0A2A4T9T1_9DELT|nr:MAG: DNA polymerase III subunit beta [SAR324 cluster bacterium]
MNIRIKRIILLEALQLIVNISPKATSEPIINNVLLETEGDNAIIVKATNYDNSFAGKFEAEILEAGKICINTSKLFNLVREFHGEDVSIKSTPQNWVYLTCGNSRIKLPGVEPELFPTIEFKDLKTSFSLPGSLFKAAIDRTFFAIGENESRKNLMGLNLKIVAPNQICWMGADAFRISQVVTHLETPIDAEGNIIIPKKSLTEVKRILDFRENNVQVSFDENTFQIFSEDVKFKTRLIEADYPNLDNLVNNVGPILLRLPKRELINAVKILYRVSDEDLNSVLKLTFTEGKALIESQKLEFGEGNDELPCDYVGEPLSIGLNIKFFMDALQVFDGAADQMITLNLTASLAPFVLQSEAWEHFKTILMPVKIKW